MSAIREAEDLRVAWSDAQGISTAPEGLVHAEDDMARPDVQKVEPGLELAAYARTGCEGFEVLQHVLRSTGRELSEVSSLLDFAGGYGRITRYMVGAVPSERVWASDVLGSAVRFVKETFGVQGFDSAADPAQLSIPHKFEVIWVASLFSHLPRDTFRAFLSVLYESLEPNGVLIFSTHTPEVLAAADRDASGFTFQRASESHILDLGDYGSTYVEPSVVREMCGELGIAHVYGLERELWRIQDLYAVSPSAQLGLENWTPASVAFGTIAKASLSPDGHAWVGGLVRVPEHEAPIQEVSLILGENRPENRKTALLRPFEGELATSEGGVRFRQTDWYTEGPVPELVGSRKPLCAVARMKSGAEWCFDATWLGQKG